MRSSSSKEQLAAHSPTGINLPEGRGSSHFDPVSNQTGQLQVGLAELGRGAEASTNHKSRIFMFLGLLPKILATKRAPLGGTLPGVAMETGRCN